VALVRERTIQTERPPLVSKVSTNFADRGVSRGQRNGSPTAVISVSRPEPLQVLSGSSSVVLTRLSGLLSWPTASQKIWYRRESNPELWLCNQELWPLDHRGGHIYIYIYIYIIIVINLDHSGRAIIGINCPRLLKHWGLGFESLSRYGYLCLSCIYIVLCEDNGLAAGWSPVQGALPIV
jgi:hypothetical protein